MVNGKYAVIFDMDGVLVDNDVYHFSAWGELCKNYGLRVEPEEVRSWFGNTNEMILKNLFGPELDPAAIRKMSDEKEELYRQLYAPDTRLTDGLASFLHELGNFGFKLAIATSAPEENVSFVLGHTGLENVFQTIIHSSHIKVGKPSPEIYLKTSEIMGSKPSECLVFEDSFHGIESARKAGMKVIGVATTHPGSELKDTVRNIESFVEIHAEDVLNILRS